MTSSIVDIDDVLYWREVMAETYYSVFEREEFSPKLVAMLTDEETEILIKSFSLKAKAVVRNVRSLVKKRESEEEIIVLEKKGDIQRELNKSFIESKSDTDTEEEEEHKNMDRKKCGINWKNIHREIPKFENNSVKFIIELERFMLVEDINLDKWFYVALRALNWKQGANCLISNRELYSQLNWKEGKFVLIELVEPNFRANWLSKIMKFRPKNENFPTYFEKFQTFSSFSEEKIDSKTIAFIFFESLPDFLKLELKKINSSDGEFKNFNNLDEIERYSKLILDKNYYSLNLNAFDKPKCYKCNKQGHLSSNCYKQKMDSKKEVKEEQSKINKKWIPYDEFIKNVVCSKCQQKGHYANKCTISVKKLEVKGCLFNNYLLRNENFVCAVESDKRNANDYIEPLKLSFRIYDNEVMGLIDTGASHSMISMTMMDKLKNNWRENLCGQASVVLASGDRKLSDRIGVELTYANKLYNVQLFVMELDVKDEFIVGRDLIYFFDLPTKHGNSIIPYNDDSYDDEKIESYDVNIEEIVSELQLNNDKTKDKIAEIEPLKLCLKEEVKSSWMKQYRCNPTVYDKIISETISDWLKNDIIEISDDIKFNSIILTVPKKNDQGVIIDNVRRVCLDLRHINKLIEDDTNDLPLIWEIFEVIGGAIVFSSLDLVSAYLQIQLSEDSKRLTSFTFNGVRYQFKRVPFGLKVAPSFFQRNIAKILSKGGCSSFCVNYFDDIIIFSQSVADHFKHMKHVINLLSEFNLTIKIDKSKLFKKKIVLLGYMLSQNNIEINERRIINMNDWKRPVTKKAVQSFIGLVNYFRNFIPKFPDLMVKFQELLTGNLNKWDWNNELEEEYQRIYFSLVNSIILRRINYDYKVQIATDASDHGVGGILFQVIDGVTYYNSIVARALRPNERKYSTPKKETLAVVFCLKKFRIFILGRPFILYCDNESLTYCIQDSTSLSWFDIISEYSFEVRHLKGIQNIIPDKLSRLFKTEEKKISLKKIEIEDEREIKKWLEKAHLLGHFGGDSMTRFLKWKGIKIKNLKMRCINYVKSCPDCQNWSNSKVKISPLSAVNSKNVWDHICIDLIGPIPRSKEEYNYIFIAVDVLSRFVVLKPLFTKSAKECAFTLCEIITSYGIPKIIQSDQGSEFVNESVNIMKSIMGFDHKLTTPYLSFQNGLVERYVQTVSNTLKKLTIKSTEEFENWNKVLGAIQFSINCKFSSIHGIQPFLLMFGREPNLFEDFSNEIIGGGEDADRIEKMLLNWTEMYEKIYPEIRMRMRKTQEKMVKDYNEKNKVIGIRKGGEYNIGDIVRYKNIKKSSKWDPTYLGPYQIKSVNKRTGNYTLCEIEDKEAIVANNIPSNWIIRSNEIKD